MLNKQQEQQRHQQWGKHRARAVVHARIQTFFRFALTINAFDKMD